MSVQIKRILLIAPSLKLSSRNFSATSLNNANHKCQVLVIGGGSGGCTVAAKLIRRLGKGKVTVLEPSRDHYYQPLWTLVGAGQIKLANTRRQNSGCIPKLATWIQDGAAEIKPEKSEVTTTQGTTISYEYLVVAAGVKNDYEKIKGLKEALDDKSSGVSTIYSHNYAEKTWTDIQNLKSGEAVFTFSHPPIKCPGAPQKIAYLTDHYLRKTNARAKTNVTYATSMPVIFGVKKYADALMKVVEKRNINLQLQTVLQEIHHDKKEAVWFDPQAKKTATTHYDLLHVTPPMSPPAFITTNKELTSADGYLSVDKYTLQHTKFPNIYGIGDCTNTPNSKTAAAVACQSWVLVDNLLQTMCKQAPDAKYLGYGACPLLTSANTCIMAEFIYDGVVHETFPFDQAKERVSTFMMKKYMFPFIYWNFMLKGYYNGPEKVRKFVNPLGR